jgi:hypothetical protein
LSSPTPQVYFSVEKKLSPVKDPNSTKYPDRIFHSGEWRTPEQIETYRKKKNDVARDKRISDPVWAVTRDIQSHACARQRRRRLLYGN